MNNKFADLIERMKERSPQSEKARPSTQRERVAGGKSGASEHGLRLPYSSNPKPVGEPWKSN
jgi:hypothetical protein